jgi:ElaB/YqjD/DUF883 family membrane-anchored ribosome-binding protein
LADPPGSKERLSLARRLIVAGRTTMADTGGKSYKDTAPPGAKVDQTSEEDLASLRSMKAAGDEWSAPEAEGMASRIADALSETHEAAKQKAEDVYDRLTETVAETAGQAGAAAREKAGEAYAQVAEIARGTVQDAATEAGSAVRNFIDKRPLPILFVAGLIGFLFGRFG